MTPPYHPNHTKLDSLAVHYGTDKSSIHHDYCKVYERYFEPLRGEPITFLELGYGGHEDPLGGGESAKMWKAYAPDWNVYVLDNEEKQNVPTYINFIRASQDNKALLESIFSENNPTVILDDASHVSSLTIRSFEILFPLLKSGGYYCVEDTHSSYHDFYYGLQESNCNPNRGNTAMNYFKRLCDEVNKDMIDEKYHLGYDISEMHFYKDLIIIKKK